MQSGHSLHYMDDCGSKTAVNSLVVSRKGGLLRNKVDSGNQDVQIRNKYGFRNKLNKKGKQTESSSKAKASNPSLHSSKGKEISGSSRGTFSSRSKLGKSSEASNKIPSHIETGPYKSSSIQDKPEASELSPSVEVNKKLELDTKNRESKIGISLEVGSSSMALSTRSKKNLIKKPGVATHLNSRGSSVPSASKSPVQMTRDSTSRYGLRNLKCNLVRDIVPSNCSSSDPSLSNSQVAAEKRNSEGENSSIAKGKRVSGLSSNGQHSSSGPTISITESGRQRIITAKREKSSSTKTERPYGNARARVSNQGMRNGTSTNNYPALDMPMSHSEVPTQTNSPIYSHRLSLETSDRTSSYNRPSAEGVHAMMSIGSVDISGVCSPVSHDSFGDYNIDEIEELILEFQRMRQRELICEQILESDPYPFLSGLNFYDQHRDMRLDIDNMSYEELLALEERMGTVSTALSEEALSKSLKRFVYKPEDGTGCVGDEDDVKCSICQEEYVAGDELGRLPCEHSYHIECIQQWLRLKNWCPVCKVSAEAS